MLQSSATLFVTGAVICSAAVLFSSRALAQTAVGESELASPSSASLCTPECASGFVCTQGFCVASEGEPETTDQSITSPGLALGAEPLPVRPAVKRPPRKVVRPTPIVADADDDDVDERPKSEDVQDWSDYRHQGFYLRIGVGLGLGWVSGSVFDFDNTGASPADGEVVAGGEFSIGGTVGPVAFGYRGVVTPDITGFTGGFFDIYPDPLEGLHIEGSAGFAGPATDDFAGILGVGYDFFFAREWSVGVTARAMRTLGTVTVSIVSLNASILCH